MKKYELSSNDLAIIKMYNKDKPVSDNAKKTLTILSCTFGGLHHVDSDQLELFDYQSTYINKYLIHESLATYDSQKLTTLVILTHDMAVRLDLRAIVLNSDNEYDSKLLKKQLENYNGEFEHAITMRQFLEESDNNPDYFSYLKLSFYQRQRTGSFSQRHPTIEDAIETTRKCLSEE